MTVRTPNCRTCGDHLSVGQDCPKKACRPFTPAHPPAQNEIEAPRPSKLYKRWALYQLAFDETTYGARAGHYIIVTEDGEEEIEVMGSFKDASSAQTIVDRHNRIVERCKKKVAPEIPSIAVFVRGGCVQDVCFGGGQVRVIVVDFDTDGVGSGIYVDPDTGKASYCNTAEYQRNAAEHDIDGEYVRAAIKTADDPWHAFRDNEEERARVERELTEALS